MTAIDMVQPTTRPARHGKNGHAAEPALAAARANAEAVDRDARFPAEAMAAARAARLLGVMVPRELGGEGMRLSEVVDICYRLGQACASTAMIYAMHQT